MYIEYDAQQHIEWNGDLAKCWNVDLPLLPPLYMQADGANADSYVPF